MTLVREGEETLNESGEVERTDYQKMVDLGLINEDAEYCDMKIDEYTKKRLPKDEDFINDKNQLE